MKKDPAIILILVVVALFLTSMIAIQNRTFEDIARERAQDQQGDTPYNFPQKIYPGKITVKLKERCGDYSLMEDNIQLGIPSLDEKISRFEVSLLKKRFIYNPDKLRAGVPDLSRIYQINFPDKYSVGSVVRAFSNDPNVEYAEPIPVNYKCEIPDDELYDQMYHLPKIEAPSAWDIHHGEDGPEILIGIVDDAVDWRHQDLVDNVWENLGEDFDGDGHVIEFNGTDWIFDPDDENGIDDDGNGMVDDFVGWDFINPDGEQDNEPSPDLPGQDHGTHCIGIANGRTNNTLQIASVAWNVKFVIAKMDQDGGQTFDFDAFQGIIYVAELGSDVITNSWTSGFYSEANKETVEYAQSLGSLVVAAAGNYNDEVLSYPASYPGVVSVAATNHLDLKASFSSYGIGVDICAPGVNILSLKPNNSTQQMSGTSMATPLAAGLFALAKSYYTGWTNESIIEQICATADDIDSLQPYLADKLGYGRINAHQALAATNPSTQQELKLRLHSSSSTDDNGNGVYEPGELINLSFTMMNWAIGVDTVPVTFKLSSNSPHIIPIDSTEIKAVPNDNFFDLDSAFVFQISDNLDSTLTVSLTISAESSLPIPLEDEWTVELLINQSGILVYNGIGTGNAYSGEYIRDFLLNNMQAVYYTQTFPNSLNGFDAVFLSFGNYGQSLLNGTYIPYESTLIMADYLYNGGYLYEDCGSFFGSMAYFDYSNLEEMLELFSVDSLESPLVQNNVDTLSGVPGSLADDLIFTGSSQSPNYYIDIMMPNSNGMAMCEENDYGIVAVQGEGEYGQKTVCFSYSIAHLENTSDRDLLMARIAEYFGLISVDIEEPMIAGNKLDIEIYPNPSKDKARLRFTLHDSQFTSIELYSISGVQVESLIDEVQQPGEYEMEIDLSHLPAGIYYLRIQAGEQVGGGKVVRME